MVVTFLVVAMNGYAFTSTNTVEPMPSLEICNAAKEIHLEIAKRKSVYAPVFVDCIQKEVQQ